MRVVAGSIASRDGGTWARSSTGASPVTVTVSCTTPTSSSNSTRIGRSLKTNVVMSDVKPASEAVRRTWPAGTPENTNEPSA